MKKVIMTVAIAILAFTAYAQTGQELDRLLATEAVGAAMAARFILPAAGLAAETVSAQDAFTLASERGWLPDQAGMERQLTMAQLSFMIMQAFGLKGGLMYSIAPGPRYAYRELVYLRIIQGSSDPSRTVSGERFLRILGRILDRREAEL